MQGTAIALAILNALTVVLYGLDKSAARRGDRRIPENMLHLLALMGGWPGAFLAQRLFHHKTEKRAFQCVFLLTVLANGACLLWMIRQ
ncbi:MAG: DUF1294 domain-containing protein [Arenimonas sp.]|jgi:uncharacterized membrane protein YsdA (DUF1294 family)|nr:DUF1294 domain-containing protein [Arenimonas sp.]